MIRPDPMDRISKHSQSQPKLRPVKAHPRFEKQQSAPALEIVKSQRITTNSVDENSLDEDQGPPTASINLRKASLDDYYAKTQQTSQSNFRLRKPQHLLPAKQEPSIFQLVEKYSNYLSRLQSEQLREEEILRQQEERRRQKLMKKMSRPVGNTKKQHDSCTHDNLAKASKPKKLPALLSSDEPQKQTQLDPLAQLTMDSDEELSEQDASKTTRLRHNIRQK